MPSSSSSNDEHGHIHRSCDAAAARRDWIMQGRRTQNRSNSNVNKRYAARRPTRLLLGSSISHGDGAICGCEIFMLRWTLNGLQLQRGNSLDVHVSK
eukprot:6196680-Pleurochrysis_carterae.AAC.2